MDTFTCLLPGGYLDATGLQHRAVELVPLSGHEEELIAGRQEPSRAALVTRILSRCVQRIGAISPISAALIRDLLVADRQYLMIKLRQATFGDQVQATMRCPWADCQQRIDIDFALSDINVIESVDRRAAYALQLSEAAAGSDATGKSYREVLFRLPTGADQENAAPLALQDETAALSLLFNRCIQSIDDQPNHTLTLADQLNPLAQAEIEGAMELVAPKVELDLSGLCPECGRNFTQPFDIQTFFFDELRTSRDRLYREVHYLAYHYHWSEQEILALPRAKRRLYIEILADEIERLNNGFQ